MSSNTPVEVAHAVSGRSWSRIFAYSLVLVMVASAFAILQTPAAGSSPKGTIGLQSADLSYMKYVIVNNFKFDPLAQTPTIPASLRYDSVPRNQPFYYLVQFNGPVTDAMKASLAATGAKILFYIPYNTFIVRADGPTIDRAAALPVVRWTGVFEPAYKLSPTLSDEYGALAQKAMDQARAGGDSIQPGATTVMGTGLEAKKVNAGTAGAALSAASLSPRADTLSTASLGGPQTSAQLGAPKATTSTITVQITAFESARVGQVVEAATLLGGTQIAYSYGQSGSIRMEIPKAALATLARVTGAMYIERFNQPYIMNDIARWVVQSGDTVNYATPVHDHGIHGTNQTITLGDTGIDYKHPDFWDPGNTTPGPNARKLTAYYKDCGSTGHCDLTDNGINHGTHTSGSAAGDDGQWHIYNGDPFGSNGTTGPHDGQAFDAFLNMQDLSDDGFGIYFDSVIPLWSDAVNHTSWIHSDSWGSVDFVGEYISDDADTDNFIWNNQDFLVFFAAANAGSSPYGINLFAVAKNVVAVGATQNGQGLENVADFSSRGPAQDGRIKPDVMAPGVQLWSAHGLCPSPCGGTDYWQLSGTSMATPTTAGSAILVRQYYMDGWYPTGAPSPNGFTPSAALIKATLINSAREMTGSGAYDNGQTFYPNDNQGFGRITLDQALFFQGDARGLTVDDHRSGINTGDTVNYNLAIGDTTLPIDITLVWSDYPATAGCNPCLVNDLDLTVTAPDGTVYKGNQYQGYNPGESQPNPNGTDHLNNVENVLVISNVQAGPYTVTISGDNIPNGPQPYALVMTGGIATDLGTIKLDKGHYQSSALAHITVVDTGLNVDPKKPDTGTVNVTSDPTGDFEVVTVTETGKDTSVFTGQIQLDNSATPNPGNGMLEVQNNDTITADYFDVNNGQNQSVHVTATAIVDDTPPVISGVGTMNLRFNRATIVWTTDEPSDSVAYWGTSTPPANVASAAPRVTDHAISLSGLIDNTTYYFGVQSTDEAGNQANDNNSGAYYSFTTPVKPPTAPPDVEWPTFHNNPPRQGISPSNFQPPLNQMWSAGPYLLQLWNGPVMRDGMVFSAPLDGTLRARDAFSGDLLWSRHLGDQYYYTGTMTTSNGVLYATFYGSAGGFVYALNEFTGDTIWVDGSNTSLDFNARIPMTYDAGLVFGTTWGGQAYALNATDGSVVWVTSLAGYTIAGAAINAGIAYFATVSGTVSALDEFSGNVVWSTTLDNTATSTPLFAQGLVYEGTYSGSMYALDAFTGNVSWQATGYGLIDVSTPAYDGLNIYFGDFNNEYIALDATTGSLVWRTSTAGPGAPSPAWANGFVYGSCWYCPLYVFDAVDGKIVDSHNIGSIGSTIWPAVSDGWVWIEDYYGDTYGFLGQLPVGLIVRPPRAHMDATPWSKVDYPINVTNIGISGPDTFEATVTLGVHGWDVSLYKADGVTPLPDTDGDGVPDTGPLATNASATVIARVTLPGSPPVNAGDQDTSIVTFTSHNDATRFKHTSLETLVPLPGVDVGPRGYFTPHPGDTVSANMNVRNTGGFNDTIDVTATSDLGWTIRLYEADGVTPLPDTNNDGIPDVGLVPGLQSVGIVVQVDVPANAPDDTVQKTSVTGTSTLNSSASGTGVIVIEIVAPPSEVWPTFHNNQKRVGASPSPHVPPMTELWASTPNLEQLWSGPVVDNGFLIHTTLDGYIRALDPWSGNLYWADQLGDTYYYTGTPTVANGVVYATFYGNAGGFVYAINENDGSIIWKVGMGETGLNFNARVAMAYHNGMVIGAAWGDFSNGQVYALDATNGNLLWSVQANGLPFGGAAVGLGAVYYVTTNGQVLSIDETTGAVLWTVMLDNTATSTPLIAQGELFIGTYSGTMYALDATSGATIWTTGGFNLIDLSTPAYDGLSIYFGDFNNEFVSLNVADGSVNWRTSINGPVGSSPAWANGFLYTTSWDGVFRVFNATTGQIVDQHALNAFASTSHPAISRGYVWLEDFNGAIYGFGGVGAGQLVALNVVPASMSLQVGHAALFTATGVDKFGNPVRVGAATWSSLNGLGSTLTLSGDTAMYIAGVFAGTDTLQAQADGFFGTATINVTPGPLDHVDVVPGVVSVVAGTTQQFSAIARDRFGNAIGGAQFTWSAMASIGTIDSTGLLTAATKVGIGTVTATTGSETGTAMVQIVPDALSYLATQPGTISLPAGSNLVIKADGFDRYGNLISGLSFSWDTTIGSIAPVESGSGTAVLAAGSLAGSGAVTIASGGQTLVVNVDVVPGPLDRIQVVMLVGSSRFEGPVDIPAGAQRTFLAEATDVFGNRIDNVPLTWSTTGNVGTIASDGTFTASTMVGSGSVIATHATGRTGEVQVTIVPAAPAELNIGLTSTSLAVDSQAVVVATVLDAYGNANHDGTVTWTTTGAGSLLLLSPDGRSILYHAPITTTPASVSITATIGAITRTITLTIVAGPPVGISIDAPATTVAVGGTLDFGVVVTDQFGNAVTGATVAWEATAGSINQQGVFTAPSEPGLVVITASTGGRTSFVVIDVTSSGFEQFSRQATTTTSLVLLFVAIIAIAVAVVSVVRGRSMRRELEEMRKGGPPPP